MIDLTKYLKKNILLNVTILKKKFDEKKRIFR